MSKAIRINSCRECKHLKEREPNELHQYYCSNGSFYSLFGKNELLDTIHPDCKLNDVPSVEEVRKYIGSHYYNDAPVMDGANFVINKITK